MTQTHPFERAGLGTAPFQCVGYYLSEYQACPGAPIQPGACCDYCFTGIKHVFVIRSSEGREFKVGCDCVYKTSGRQSDMAREARTLKRDTMRREARKARDEAPASYAQLLFLAKLVGPHIVALATTRQLASAAIDGAMTGKRWAEREAKAARDAASEFQGTVDKRIEFEATIIAMPSWNTIYGGTWLWILETEEGHKFTWKTNSPRGLDRGSKVRLRGTVKAHTVYKGVKQTQLARCKVL